MAGRSNPGLPEVAEAGGLTLVVVKYFVLGRNDFRGGMDMIPVSLEVKGRMLQVYMRSASTSYQRKFLLKTMTDSVREFQVPYIWYRRYHGRVLASSLCEPASKVFKVQVDIISARARSDFLSEPYLGEAESDSKVQSL